MEEWVIGQDKTMQQHLQKMLLIDISFSASSTSSSFENWQVVKKFKKDILTLALFV